MPGWERPVQIFQSFFQRLKGFIGYFLKANSRKIKTFWEIVELGDLQKGI